MPGAQDGTGASVMRPGGRGAAVRGAAVGSAVGAGVVVVLGGTYTGVRDTDRVRSGVPLCESVLRVTGVRRACVSDTVNVAAHAPIVEPQGMNSTPPATAVGTVVACCAVAASTRVLTTAGVHALTTASA
jgi:hypothetical protein